MVNINIPNTNERAQIVIKSLAHSEIISFFPYDFEFDDTYRPEWNPYDSFGRMDPIMTYKRTTRDVNLSFNVVAENANMAVKNFKNLQKLIKCLYPTYARPTSNIQSFVENLEKLREEKLKQKNEIEAVLENMGAAETTQTTQVQEDELISQGLELNQLNAEISKAEQDIAQAFTDQAQEKALISDFGIGIINKSPLFQISFMNFLKTEEHVAAITNFKHKMKFDSADTSFSVNGVAIPGEFNINFSFKVLHTYIPGDRLNYR